MAYLHDSRVRLDLFGKGPHNKLHFGVRHMFRVPQPGYLVVHVKAVQWVRCQRLPEVLPKRKVSTA